MGLGWGPCPETAAPAPGPVLASLAPVSSMAACVAVCEGSPVCLAASLAGETCSLHTAPGLGQR